MGYISAEEVKKIRNEIKKELPEFKFSVTLDDHSGVCVSLMEGPFDHQGHEQLNHYYYQEHFKDQPEFVAMWDKVMKIVRGQKEVSYTGDSYSDYGSQPNYYIYLHVGKWDKHYKKAA